MTTKYSEGVKVKKIKWIEFGNILLNLENLNDKQILSVKYYSNAGIKGIQKTNNLSQEFITIINEIIDNNKINYEVGKTLNTEEKELLKKLLYVSKIGKEFKFNENNLIESIVELKKRLYVIQGEIVAGNNNPLLIHKAIHIISKLINDGGIDQTEGTEILNELKNNI